jgi:hypothetical protein
LPANEVVNDGDERVQVALGVALGFSQGAEGFADAAEGFADAAEVVGHDDLGAEEVFLGVGQEVLCLVDAVNASGYVLEDALDAVEAAIVIRHACWLLS